MPSLSEKMAGPSDNRVETMVKPQTAVHRQIQQLREEWLKFQDSQNERWSEMNHRLEVLENEDGCARTTTVTAEQEQQFIRRVNSLESNLQALSSRFQMAQPRQQAQRRTLHSLQAQQRARPPSNAVGSTLSQFEAAMEQSMAHFQLRASVRERRQLGVTLDFLEAETQELYEFKQSSWDLSVFIGAPSLGFAGSGLTCMLLLTTVFMQIVFIGIAWFNFTEATIDETTIQDAFKWRTDDAHYYRYVDLRSGFSLVSRVCQNDKSLPIASSQEELFDLVNMYLKPEATGLEHFFAGSLLCVASLVCWFLMVSKEMHDAVDLFRAIIHLDCTTRTKLEPIERLGHPMTYRLISVSRSRLLFSAIIVVYRLLVSGLLGYTGTFFLVYTIEISELVLNAVALDIILNIDDLIFAALVTANARYLVLKLEPLEMPRWPHRDGVDLKAFGMVVIIPCIAILVNFEMISPMVDNLSKVADTLCGGTRNFAYSTDKLKMMNIATTIPCTDRCQNLKNASNRVHSLAVQRAVNHGLSNVSEYAVWVGDYHVLQNRLAYSFEESVADVAQGLCIDNLQGSYLNHMRQIAGNTFISDCNDVKHWCSSASFEPEWGPDGGKGLMARLFCPHTCGCNNPGGGSVFQSGCPATCTSKAHPVYRQRLNISTVECRDMTLKNISESHIWKKWAAQLHQFSAFKNDKGIGFLASSMVKSGCNSIWEFVESSECVWSARYRTAFKGLAFFCPQKCKCYHFSQAPACLDPCPHRRRRGSKFGYGEVGNLSWLL